MQEGDIMKTIGLIGAGHIGSQVARLGLAHGYNVVISDSRPGDAGGARRRARAWHRAATPAEAATAGNLVVVTVPLKNYRDVPVAPLAGKIVIDANNYYPSGTAISPSSTTSRPRRPSCCRSHLPTSKVVKAFNHIYAAELTTHGQPAGWKSRRALVIAGR